MFALLLSLASPAPWRTVQAAVVSHEWAEADRILRGRVVSPDGNPIGGAAIHLRTKLPRESVAVGKTISGADGRFTLDVVPARDDDNFVRWSFLEIGARDWAPGRLERVYLPPPSYDLGEVVLHPPVEAHDRWQAADRARSIGAR